MYIGFGSRLDHGFGGELANVHHWDVAVRGDKFRLVAS
jgi:hypothetical protein